ncbi:hypothetical protein P4S68_07280 [Pseudoalteromonas sp. Hal099]
MWNVESDDNVTGYKNGAVILIMLGFIAYSFTFTGHSTNENGLVKSILTFHLIAIASWLGHCGRFTKAALYYLPVK